MTHEYLRDSVKAKELYKYLRNLVKNECRDVSIPSWKEIRKMSKTEYKAFLEELNQTLFEKCTETADVNGMRHLATEVFKRLFGELPEIQKITQNYQRKRDKVGCQGDYPVRPFDEEYLEETVYADEKI